MKSFITLLIYIIPWVLLGQNRSVSLIFVGDVMQHDSQLNAAGPDSSGLYNYHPNYQYVKPIIEAADLAFANLELTLAGKPFSGYPTFSAPDEIVDALQFAGFDILLTANNHSLDRRKNGLERTIKVLDEKRMPHTGTFKDQESRRDTYPLIVEKNGLKIAVLNYTYGTNGIPVQSPNVVNLIDTATIKNDLVKANDSKVDLSIVVFHWGKEYQRVQNNDQKDLAHFALENGANMVIGSHPHVIQPIERISKDGNDQIIAYSLGNFISNQRKRYTDGGMLLKIEVKESEYRKFTIKVDYDLTWTYKQSSPSQFYIIPVDLFHDDPSILTNQEAIEQLMLFEKDSKELMSEYNKGVEDFPEAAVNTTPEVIKDQGSYKIQIFTSSGQFDTTQVPQNFQKYLVSETQNGLIKYMLGPFETLEKTEEILTEVRKIEIFRDAFIINP